MNKIHKKETAKYNDAKWPMVKLKDICEINPETADPRIKFKTGFFTYIDISSIGNGNGRVYLQNHISINKAPSRARRTVKNNDVIISTVRPNLKAFALLKNLPDRVIASTGFAILRVKSKLDPNYLFFIINTHQVVKQMIIEMDKGVYPSINKDDIEKIKIPLPPLAEQKRIVEILSTWDQAIEKLDRLINFKKRRKKILMQQFLTGKKRFKDFKTVGFKKEPIKGVGKIPDDWSVCHLSDCSEILFSNVDKKSKLGEKDVFLCNYSDVYKNDVITPELPFMKATAKDSLINKFRIKNDDVIITKDSETPNDIAVPAYVVGHFDNVLCGYHLAILRTKKKNLSGKFLHLLLHLKPYQYYFFTLSNGVTRFGLNMDAVKKAAIFMPSVEEQENISNVIFSLQKEISLLIRKKTIFKDQKKGLMQKLLTGKWRIKV